MLGITRSYNLYEVFCQLLYLRMLHNIMRLRSRRPQIQMNIDRIGLTICDQSVVLIYYREGMVYWSMS